MAEHTSPGGETATPAGESTASVSALERVRRVPMAPAAVALGLSLVLGLLLSFMVPDDPGALALMVLGAAVAAAAGFTVRTLSRNADGWTLATAAIAAAFGAHVMAVTGAVGGENEVLSMIGAEGPSFNDALLAALATPPFSAGTLLAGVVAALITGWGRPWG
ncbi:hypothetical protein [Demequina sp. NBRC 110051]|uniref:hypothetical protein n=1 Tax=Demequina sp. NBRC 110051 TaxID=1570340 RepID=UPI000A0717F7|nr:hypothetical protein [Demequina sp. NBRC 110051]